MIKRTRTSTTTKRYARRSAALTPVSADATNMINDLTTYEHLWADSDGPYALFQLNPGKEEVARFVVVNRSDRTVLIIEDDEIAQRVKQRMLAAGVPVVWVGNGF